MRARLDSLSRATNRLAEAVLAALLAAMTLVVGLQVAGRFLFRYSIPWSDELGRFLLVWISFLGVSVAARRLAHPGIDSLVRLLPPAAARVAVRLALLLCVLFLAAVVFYGGELVARTWGQRSPTLELRMGWIYLAVPVSALLVLLHWAAVGRATAEPGETGGDV